MKMKNYNKFIILSLFIVTLVCITGVSATDNSTDALNSVQLDDVSDSVVLADDGDNSTSELNSTGDENITGDNDEPSSVSVNTTTSIVVENASTRQGKSLYINASVLDGNETVNVGNATIHIIGQNKNLNYTTGIFNNSFIWTPITAGEYTVYIHYLGGTHNNITYLPSTSENYTFTVVPVNLAVENVTLEYLNGRFYATVYSDGNPVKNQSLIFRILGVNYTAVTDDEGRASLAINLRPGSYNITTIVRGTDVNETSTIDVHVNASLVKLDAYNLNKYYKDSKRFTVKVSYMGKAISNQKVTVNIGKSTYTLKTNRNGSATLAVNLRPGNYKFNSAVSFFDVNKTVSSNVKVNKWNKKNVKFTVRNLTKRYQNSSQFTAQLKYGSDAIANEKVYFKINGKTYTKLTNKNGVATLTINQGVGSYRVTSTVNSAGVKLSKSATAKVIKAYPSLSFQNVQLDIKVVDNNNITRIYKLQKGKNLVSVFTNNNKALSKFTVTIGVNSYKTYKTLKTDKQGKVSYSTKNLKYGSKNFVITFYSNNKNYNSVRYVIPIQITK